MSKTFLMNLTSTNILNLYAGNGKIPFNLFLKQLINTLKIIRKNQIYAFFGDVNSTLAIAIACNKMNVKIAHIEAGLRSYDKSML